MSFYDDEFEPYRPVNRILSDYVIIVIWLSVSVTSIVVAWRFAFQQFNNSESWSAIAFSFILAFAVMVLAGEISWRIFRTDNIALRFTSRLIKLIRRSLRSLTRRISRD